ncbi:hypothetical protein V1478_007465 [Vespula squamosa]|uniref:Uncharacterized protein n=1 Tax=Vespula squamosa TaxID=30214 RepID=A0ABD2B383_VESSQ
MAEEFPNKDQAIVLDNIDGISDQEYTDVISKIVGLENIKYIFRNANEPMQIFFINKEIVNNLICDNNEVHIGTNVVRIRPLIPRLKRIILCNVYPIIPSSVIEKEINKLNIQLTSQITCVKKSNDPNYAHIYGSNREMYIRLEDVSKLPGILQIRYDDTNYLIQLLTDITVYNEEHTTGNYNIGNATRNVLNITDGKNNENNITYPPQFKDTNEPINLQNAPVRNSIMNPQPSTSRTAEIVLLSPDKKPTYTENDLPLLSSSLTNSNFGNVLQKVKEKKTQVIKSKITNTMVIPKPTSIKQHIQQHLLPAKDYIMNNRESSGVGYRDFQELIYATYINSVRTTEIVMHYTNNISEFNHLLSNVKKMITDSSIKSQITKIMNHLKKIRS